ncbi:EAL domain-containing protein [Nodosilinea nodulosa]|uniref:EAL domain-containing protein n=1 Tax=Nodosilinea nodulosa TaxID=416001 RepID=UPI0002DFE6A4|nr:EAL domain-containing protein [Nodosilinea nodulosa]
MFQILRRNLGVRSDASTKHRPIRLSIVTQFFPPDFAATGQYMDELATQLGQQGFAVQVFTGQPSYAFEVAEAPAQEQKGPVHITRSNLLRSRSRRMAGRTISSLAFCVHAAWHLLKNRRQSDITLFVSEPPYVQVVGFLLHLLFGTPYAALVYDLYPDVVSGLGMLPARHPVVRLWDAINRRVWQRAEAVIVPCETMKARIVAKHPDLGDRIAVIHNWSDPDWVKPLAKADNAFAQAQGLAETFTVLYSGNMGRCHDMDTILGAAQALQGEPVQFLFIGGGPKRDATQSQIAELGLTNCRFLPYQDKALLPQSLTACDLHLVSIDTDMEGLVAPSKFYSALSSGRPVAIICESHSYLRGLVSEANCGAAFSNGDSQGLASFIHYLLKDREVTQQLGLSGHRFIRERFTVGAISRQYYRLLRRAVVKNADLYQAIERSEFEVYYQPIVNLGNGRIDTLEALVRWHHPQRGLLLPEDFLPAAQDTALIIPLGWWVLEQACQQLATWQQQFPEKRCRISLNLSTQQFLHPDLFTRLDQALTSHHLRGEDLVLELKDHTVMADTAATTGIVTQLQARGIQLCIDGIGTSYASLSFLHRYPVSSLKIDARTINRLDIDPKLAEWLKSLIIMTHDLHIDLVALGIETAFQHRRTREMGMTYGQGFGFTKPEPAATITRLLAHSNPFSFLLEPLPLLPTMSHPEDTSLVLVVDDDRSLRRLLTLAVKQAGYRTLEATNGSEALALYQQHHPDLVLLDAMMPEVNGFTCCRQIRTLQAAEALSPSDPAAATVLTLQRQPFPILMITALDDDSSVEQAFAAGATDYLTKPINWSILKQRLRQLLG